MKTHILENSLGQPQPGTTRYLRMDAVPDMNIQPGAGISLTIDDITRPFSFFNAPDDPVWTILIRDVPDGEFGRRVAHLRKGDVIDVGGYFHFFDVKGIATADAPIYVFATGVGIAPFSCGIKSRLFQPTKIFYGAKTTADLVLDGSFLTQNVELYASREKQDGVIFGRVDQGVTPEILHPNARYFLCGLDEMVSTVSSKLIALGATYDQISSELFYMKG
jgi:ferredoxin-NADP reductase